MMMRTTSLVVFLAITSIIILTGFVESSLDNVPFEEIKMVPIRDITCGCKSTLNVSAVTHDAIPQAFSDVCECFSKHVKHMNMSRFLGLKDNCEPDRNNSTYEQSESAKWIVSMRDPKMPFQCDKDEKVSKVTFTAFPTLAIFPLNDSVMCLGRFIHSVSGSNQSNYLPNEKLKAPCWIGNISEDANIYGVRYQFSWWRVEWDNGTIKPTDSADIMDPRINFTKEEVCEFNQTICEYSTPVFPWTTSVSTVAPTTTISTTASTTTTTTPTPTTTVTTTTTPPPTTTTTPTTTSATTTTTTSTTTAPTTTTMTTTTATTATTEPPLSCASLPDYTGFSGSLAIPQNDVVYFQTTLEVPELFIWYKLQIAIDKYTLKYPAPEFGLAWYQLKPGVRYGIALVSRPVVNGQFSENIGEWVAPAMMGTTLPLYLQGSSPTADQYKQQVSDEKAKAYCRTPDANGKMPSGYPPLATQARYVTTYVLMVCDEGASKCAPAPKLPQHNGASIFPGDERDCGVQTRSVTPESIFKSYKIMSTVTGGVCDNVWGNLVLLTPFLVKCHYSPSIDVFTKTNVTLLTFKHLGHLYVYCNNVRARQTPEVMVLFIQIDSFDSPSNPRIIPLILNVSPNRTDQAPCLASMSPPLTAQRCHDCMITRLTSIRQYCPTCNMSAFISVFALSDLDLGVTALVTHRSMYFDGPSIVQFNDRRAINETIPAYFDRVLSSNPGDVSASEQDFSARVAKTKSGSYFTLDKCPLTMTPQTYKRRRQAQSQSMDGTKQCKPPIIRTLYNQAEKCYQVYVVKPPPCDVTYEVTNYNYTDNSTSVTTVQCPDYSQYDVSWNRTAVAIWNVLTAMPVANGSCVKLDPVLWRIEIAIYTCSVFTFSKSGVVTSFCEGVTKPSGQLEQVICNLGVNLQHLNSAEIFGIVIASGTLILWACALLYWFITVCCLKKSFIMVIEGQIGEDEETVQLLDCEDNCEQIELESGRDRVTTERAKRYRVTLHGAIFFMMIMPPLFMMYAFFALTTACIKACCMKRPKDRKLSQTFSQYVKNQWYKPDHAATLVSSRGCMANIVNFFRLFKLAFYLIMTCPVAKTEATALGAKSSVIITEIRNVCPDEDTCSLRYFLTRYYSCNMYDVIGYALVWVVLAVVYTILAYKLVALLCSTYEWIIGTKVTGRMLTTENGTITTCATRPTICAIVSMVPPVLAVLCIATAVGFTNGYASASPMQGMKAIDESIWYQRDWEKQNVSEILSQMDDVNPWFMDNQGVCIDKGDGTCQETIFSTTKYIVGMNKYVSLSSSMFTVNVVSRQFLTPRLTYRGTTGQYTSWITYTTICPYLNFPHGCYRDESRYQYNTAWSCTSAKDGIIHEKWTSIIDCSGLPNPCSGHCGCIVYSYASTENLRINTPNPGCGLWDIYQVTGYDVVNMVMLNVIDRSHDVVQSWVTTIRMVDAVTNKCFYNDDSTLCMHLTLPPPAFVRLPDAVAINGRTRLYTAPCIPPNCPDGSIGYTTYNKNNGGCAMASNIASNGWGGEVHYRPTPCPTKEEAFSDYIFPAVLHGILNTTSSGVVLESPYPTFSAISIEGTIITRVSDLRPCFTGPVVCSVTYVGEYASTIGSKVGISLTNPCHTGTLLVNTNVTAAATLSTPAGILWTTDMTSYDIVIYITNPLWLKLEFRQEADDGPFGTCVLDLSKARASTKPYNTETGIRTGSGYTYQVGGFGFTLPELIGIIIAIIIAIVALCLCCCCFKPIMSCFQACCTWRRY